jgi:CheY-like chemotaxis protein/HPt (histidine-containing phosphotransfer) domain-containing protein
MNGVIGMIDLMMESSMTQDQRSIMRTVRDSSFSLLNIITDILDFSKIEAGKLELEHVSFDLNNVVESVVDTMQISAREKRVCLDLHTDLNIPLELVGDPLRLRQVIFNIIGNAIKFSAQAGQDGHVWVRTRLISSESTRIQLQLQVVDNGIGIRKEELDNLFLPFTQAESSTTRRFGGTGLGLAICHNLITLMGGQIKVESHYGHGATFNIELPLNIGRRKETLRFDSSNLMLLLDTHDSSLRDLCQEYLDHLGIESMSLGAEQSQKDLLLQYLDQGVFVILVKDHSHPGYLDTLYHRYNHFKQLLLISDGQMSPGVINGYTYGLEGHPLKASGLILALNILLGRESPEADIEPESECTKALEVPESIHEAEQQGRLILVAEDNLVNQDVISRQLKTLGYLCVVATDGIEAEKMYDLYRYSMVLTDCHMPRRDGYELAKILKHKQKELGTFVPIIAITANALLGEAEKCYDAGMDDYLAKPVELSKLRKALEQWAGKLNLPNIESTHIDVQNKQKTNILFAQTDNRQNSSAQETESGIVLDERVIETIYGGELDDYRDSLKDFQELVLPKVAHIHDYIADDLSNLKAKLHQYKSPAKAVGVSLLAALLEEIEALCLDDPVSLEQIGQRIDHLQQILPEIDKVITEKISNLK